MNYQIYHICLMKTIGGLEKMFLNYDKILKNHISIISKDSLISKNIENKNIIYTTKFYFKYLLFNLINNNQYTIFICHEKLIYRYLSLLKYYFKYKLIILMINHDSYDLCNLINHRICKYKYKNNYVVKINRKFDKFLENVEYDENKLYLINNFSICFERKIIFKSRLKNIGFIGRLGPEKGCFNMLKQLNKLLKSKKYKLNIYGNGEEYNKIFEYINYNKLNNYVKLHDWINDISECYLNNDLIIVPSNIETFGLNIVDAFYYNCPCIISDKVLINDDIIFNEFNCLIYNNDNILDLEKKICKLKNDKKLFKYIQINAFDTFHKKLNHYIAKQKLNNCIKNIIIENKIENYSKYTIKNILKEYINYNIYQLKKSKKIIYMIKFILIFLLTKYKLLWILLILIPLDLFKEYLKFNL